VASTLLMLGGLDFIGDIPEPLMNLYNLVGKFLYAGYVVACEKHQHLCRGLHISHMLPVGFQVLAFGHFAHNIEHGRSVG